MNLIGGALIHLAVFSAIVFGITVIYLIRTMNKDIEAAETEEKRVYLINGRKQMIFLILKILPLIVILMAAGVALY